MRHAPAPHAICTPPHAYHLQAHEQSWAVLNAKLCNAADRILTRGTCAQGGVGRPGTRVSVQEGPEHAAWERTGTALCACRGKTNCEQSVKGAILESLGCGSGQDGGRRITPNEQCVAYGYGGALARHCGGCTFFTRTTITHPPVKLPPLPPKPLPPPKPPPPP